MSVRENRNSSVKFVESEKYNAVQTGKDVESTVSCFAVQGGMQCKLEKMLKTLYTPRHAPENQRHTPETSAVRPKPAPRA